MTSNYRRWTFHSVVLATAIWKSCGVGFAQNSTATVDPAEVEATAPQTVGGAGDDNSVQSPGTISSDRIAELLAVPLPALATPGEGAMVSSHYLYELEGRLTPECHASTICETSDGLVAAWFGGTKERHVDTGIWFSRLEDGKWNTPVELVNGSENESEDYACWNPVLFQPTGGPLLLFYKVGPTPRDWWGCAMSSTDNGRTWSKPWRLGTSEKLSPKNPNLLGPVKNKAYQLADGAILCPSSTENEGWRVHFEITRDLGKTFEVIVPIDANKVDAIQPSVLTYPDGRLQILCRTKQSYVASSWSKDQGQTWSDLEPINLPNPNSGTDAVTLDDQRQLLVYNHTIRADGLNGRQKLHVAISNDGMKWEPVMTLENDGDAVGYSYPAVIQSADGLVHITYTWRRIALRHVVIDPKKL